MIRLTFRSSNRGKDGIEFVRSVDGRELQIHKLWVFAEDGITHEVDPVACVDVSDLSGDCFQTQYMTKESCRVTNFGQRSIHASVKHLSTPVPVYNTTGVPWTYNILVPELRWGERGNHKTWALKTQFGVRFVGISVPWRGIVPLFAVYLPRSPVNMRAIARRIRDICLREKHLVRDKTLLRAHHPNCDGQGNWSNNDWYG